MLKCTPIKENITVYEGDDCTLEFVSSLGDITGASIRLQARIDTSSRYAIIDVDGVILDSTKGSYSVTLPSGDTLGKASEDSYHYDVKIIKSDGSIHTDRSGMMTIDARTTDLTTTKTTTVYGVDVDQDGNLLRAKAQQVNFLGAGVKLTSNNQGGVDIEIDRSATAPTLALQFAGIYDDIQALNDAVPKPSEHMQAIVIQPSEYYYHVVGSSWQQLAPVGSFHPKYLGAYDTVIDLRVAEPTPDDDSLAIVGTTSKTFYVYESGKWDIVNHADIPGLDARLTTQENKMVTTQKDVSDLQTVSGKNTSDIAALYAPDKATFDAKLDARLVKPEADISALQASTAQIQAAQTSSEKIVTDNTKRLGTAEQHLQTLQSNDQKHDSEISAIGNDITQLQGQVYDGNDISDDDGNSLSDITGLKFVGAQVSDDDGDRTATVTVSPKITVADGQQPGSHSEMGNAIVFEGSQVSADPNDPNVIKVAVHATSHNGITLGDGANASREVQTILFNGHQAYGSGTTAEIHIEFVHFKTIAERDAWTAKFSTHMDFDVIALVDADENGFVAYYKFDAATKVWLEYDAQGVVMSDSNGAIPKNIKTVVFGPGFTIQQAGDQEDAALVTYSETGDGGIDGITVSQDWGNSAESTKVTAVQTMYPIEVNQNQIGDTPLEGNAMLSIDPRAYETQHGNACLVKLDMVQTVAGQHPHAVYMTEEVVPTGEYFNLNAQGRGIDVQDSTGGDTAETGGQMTEVLVKVSFLDTAPEDGVVNVWLEYKDPSDVIAKEILLDVNGNPLAVGRHCNVGDTVGEFIIAGAFMAKATQPLKVMVETEFDVNSKITLDPVNTMVCLNQFSNGYETSVARIEFLRRAAIQITPAMQKFDNKMLSLSDELKGVNQILTVIGVGDAGDTLNEFGIQNLTSVGVKIENDTLTVKDAGSLADFYVDTLIDNTHTRMLRGKEVTSAITIANPDGAFEYEAYKWAGKPDHVTQVYSGRSNDTITINDGWTVIKGVFIAEQVNGNAYGHVLTFDVPEDANNVLILVRPQLEQSPSTLELQEFDWGTSTDFTGYVEIERYKSREDHYRFDEAYGEYALNNTGYQALRYTINNTPSTGNPMPVGVLLKGKAPIEIDNTVNQVSGSIDPAHDGAIKFLKDGEASISKSYNLWDEQGTDNTVTFWDVLIDTDGNETKIPESEKTFTVKANTGAPGVVYSIPAYAVDVETGQRVGGRATSNKVDGAYVQSQNISEYIVQTIVDFKELVADAGDTSDLISAPLNKSLVVDRRYYTFSGNTAQNVNIADLSIPSDVMLKGVTVEVKGVDGFSSEQAEHRYKESTQTLVVHVGGVSSGTIFLEFWSK
ncbi:hypothetical protein NVP1068O_12 [Vibrio phage 1.068.O._10N.261.51.F8]|nr:hypothetical protein NVP1068O_12 [Vibrio phage 1.068.O._10N.261.51.F8]